MMHPFYEDRQQNFRCFSVDNLTFPAHLHNTAELIFVQNGALEVTIQNHRAVLHTHEAALIFPNMIHSYRTEETCKTCLSIFAPGQAKDYFHFFRSMEPEVPFFTSGTVNSDLPLAFERMLSYSGIDNSLSEAWLNLILAHLFHEAALIPRTRQDSPDFSYQLISYLSQHFQEPLSLDHVAKELHYNKYYISRVFSSHLHCSFPEYVNRLRLDYAAHQLRFTNRKITEIWQEAGFESQKTFNRTFRSCYGMAPAQFRKKLVTS